MQACANCSMRAARSLYLIRRGSFVRRKPASISTAVRFTRVPPARRKMKEAPATRGPHAIRATPCGLASPIYHPICALASQRAAADGELLGRPLAARLRLPASPLRQSLDARALSQSVAGCLACGQLDDVLRRSFLERYRGIGQLRRDNRNAREDFAHGSVGG